MTLDPTSLTHLCSVQRTRQWTASAIGPFEVSVVPKVTAGCTGVAEVGPLASSASCSNSSRLFLPGSLAKCDRPLQGRLALNASLLRTIIASL